MKEVTLKAVYEDNVLRELWDDLTRTYTSYDEKGQITSTRSYTDAENLALDEKLSRQEASRQNEPMLRQTLAESIPTLLNSIEVLNAIKATPNSEITPKHTKDTAQHARIVARQVVALIRVITEQTSSTDIGAA